jgi:hypothetical protein
MLSELGYWKENIKVFGFDVPDGATLEQLKEMYSTDIRDGNCHGVARLSDGVIHDSEWLKAEQLKKEAKKQGVIKAIITHGPEFIKILCHGDSWDGGVLVKHGSQPALKLKEYAKLVGYGIEWEQDEEGVMTDLIVKSIPSKESPVPYPIGDTHQLRMSKGGFLWFFQRMGEGFKCIGNYLPDDTEIQDVVIDGDTIVFTVSSQEFKKTEWLPPDVETFKFDQPLIIKTKDDTDPPVLFYRRIDL